MFPRRASGLGIRGNTDCNRVPIPPTSNTAGVSSLLLSDRGGMFASLSALSTPTSVLTDSVIVSMTRSDSVPVFQHRVQCFFEGIQRFPTRVLSDLQRASEDNFFIRGAH